MFSPTGLVHATDSRTTQYSHDGDARVTLRTAGRIRGRSSFLMHPQRDGRPSWELCRSAVALDVRKSHACRAKNGLRKLFNGTTESIPVHLILEGVLDNFQKKDAA
jgi:hypothetical protein